MHFFAFWTIIDYVLYVINLSMKEVFIQFRQWILKYRKRLIYGALALFIGQICFFNLWWIWIENEVFANETASQNSTFQENATKWQEKLLFVKKMVYILIYPLLVVAWKLVDNSLVYWEIFNFDVVLWNLWNIVKNLANFTLWFMFVYYIFRYLITKDKKMNPKDLIIKSLIAWIWIQASWFIMAALIDISTIVTYSVWWLPISILKENTSWNADENLKYNPYVFKDVVYADVKDIDKINIYLTNIQSGDVEQFWSFYISECDSFSYKWDGNSEELILAPKMIYYYDGHSLSGVNMTDYYRCHFGGQIYYFQRLHDKFDDGFRPTGSRINWKFSSCWDFSGCNSQQMAYDAKLKEIKDGIRSSQTGEVEKLIAEAKLLQVWDAHVAGWVPWKLWPILYSTGDMYGLDLYNKWTWQWWLTDTSKPTTSRLQDILDGDSYVGVFTALYSSLMNLWRWVIPVDAWELPSLLDVLLSLCYVISIWIPLIAVSVVFMLRIGVLWSAIVLAPFIILLKVFGLEDKVFGKDLWKYWKVENLIPIIFAPAIVCFAISISMVLVTIISKMNVEGIETVKTQIMWWFITLDVWWLCIGMWRFIVSVLSIAVTRFLVWAAVEMTELWKSGLIQWMKKLARDTIWSAPIIPFPTKEGWWTSIWIDKAFGLNNKSSAISDISQTFKNKYDAWDNEALEAWLKPDEAAEEAATLRASSYWDKLVSLGVADLGTDWREKEIKIWEWSNQKSITFNSLGDAEKEEVIKKINNIQDSNTRAAFRVWDIEIWEWGDRKVYKFDGNDNKYKV